MGNDLFNSIAGVYGWFHRYQMKRFSSILDQHAEAVGLSSIRTICDVGCGTGALCAVLAERGFSVTGVDPAEKMLAVAKRKAVSPNVEFLQGDALEGLPFVDDSFDLVV